MTTATATAPVREDLKIGGHYTAVKNPDGTYDIKNVCIFAEIPAGVKRNKDAIGKDWQDAALLQSKAREASGHLPPVHIYHTDEMAVKPIFAGKLRLREVRQTTYEGKRLWATFADILGMPGDIFESKVRKGFLPYRSVEIHNWAKPEIDSLALMDTDVPFFRMPMLTIGNVVQSDAEMFIDKTRPTRACRLGKRGGGLILFRFSERGDMEGKEDDKDKDAKPDEGTKEPALNAPPETDETSTEGAADVDDDGGGEDPAQKGPGGAEMEDEGKAPPGGETPAAPVEEKAVKVDLGPVMSMLQSLGTLLKQLNDRLGPQAEPKENEGAVAGVDLGREAQGQDFKDEIVIQEEANMADKDPVKDQVVMSKNDLKALISETVDAAVLKATTPLMAEVSTFKSTREADQKSKDVEARFAAAKKELTENGQHVNEDLEKHLRKCAGVGEEFMKEQVAVFKANLPKDPPTDGADFEDKMGREAGSSEAGAETEAINAFVAEHGPRWGAWAKAQAAKHKKWESAGGSETSLEEWLVTNFRSETMGERNKV